MRRERESDAGYLKQFFSRAAVRLLSPCFLSITATANPGTRITRANLTGREKAKNNWIGYSRVVDQGAGAIVEDGVSAIVQAKGGVVVHLKDHLPAKNKPAWVEYRPSWGSFKNLPIGDVHIEEAKLTLKYTPATTKLKE